MLIVLFFFSKNNPQSYRFAACFEIKTQSYEKNKFKQLIRAVL